MTAQTDQPEDRSIFARMRGSNGLKVSDYLEGDAVDKDRVIVNRKATVVGDTIAPKVEIHGVLCGNVIGKEVTVHGGGKVWGDVYAVSLNVEKDGCIYGWVTTISADTFETLSDDPSKSPPPPEMPEALANDGESSLISHRRVAALHQLQESLGKVEAEKDAIIARFDKSLKRRVGEVLEEVEQLRQVNQEAEEEKERLAEDLYNTRFQLVNVDAEVELLKEKLEAVKRNGKVPDEHPDAEEWAAELESRVKSIEDLESQLSIREELIGELESEKESLISRIESFKREAADESEASKGLLARVRQLESERETLIAEINELKFALGNRTASQDENGSKAAGVTDASTEEKSQKVFPRRQDSNQELEEKYTALQHTYAEIVRERDQLRDQAAEAAALADTIRDSSHEQQNEIASMNTMLEEAVAERDSLHAQVTELEHDISEQEQMVADLQASRQDQLNSLSVELESAKLERDQFVNKLNVANSKVASLQEELDRIQARTEQADGRVAEAAKIVEQHQAQVSRLHESNADLQQSVGRLTKLLYIAEQRVVMFKDEVERAQSELHSSTTTLEERLQQQQTRQMADSMELGELRKAVDEQRRRLADAQATLVERDVALKQAESKSKEQVLSLERFRQVAGNRIRELEDELADHRQRLQDLSQWLDKRRMRGENVTEENA